MNFTTAFLDELTKLAIGKGVSSGIQWGRRPAKPLGSGRTIFGPPPTAPAGRTRSTGPSFGDPMAAPPVPAAYHGIYSNASVDETSSLFDSFIDEFSKMAEKKKKMPHFTEQDRPEGVKKVYRALEHDPKKQAEMRSRYGPAHKAVAARIAARQGKKGKQHQGPPYKAQLST